jgi:hypothetical protein
LNLNLNLIFKYLNSDQEPQGSPGSRYVPGKCRKSPTSQVPGTEVPEEQAGMDVPSAEGQGLNVDIKSTSGAD